MEGLVSFLLGVVMIWAICRIGFSDRVDLEKPRIVLGVEYVNACECYEVGFDDEDSRWSYIRTEKVFTVGDTLTLAKK